MKITSAEGFRCPACGSVGLGEIKTFDDDGGKCGADKSLSDVFFYEATHKGESK